MPADARRLLEMLAERFQANRCSLVAGSLAFTTLLSLVPLVTLTIVVFGHFQVFAGLGEELRLFLVQNLLPDKAGRIIATYAVQFSQKAANLTLLGGALLALGAFSLILTIDREFNQIWGVRHPRPWTVRVPLYWATLTIGPLVAAGAVTASSFVLSTSLGLVDEPAWVRGAALRSAPFVLQASENSIKAALPRSGTLARSPRAAVTLATSVIPLGRGRMRPKCARSASLKVLLLASSMRGPMEARQCAAASAEIRISPKRLPIHTTLVSCCNRHSPSR